MTFLEALSVIVGGLGFFAGVIAYFRAQSAERAAEQSVEKALAQSAEALGRSKSAATDAAGAARQVSDLADVAQLADRKADRAQKTSEEALTRSTAAIKEVTGVVQRVGDNRGASAAVKDVASWECEQVRKSIWVARNVGTAVARAALLSDATWPPKYVRPDEVIPRDVAPGDHLQFRAFPDKGVRSPRIKLAWTDGDDTPHAQEMTLIIE